MVDCISSDKIQRRKGQQCCLPMCSLALEVILAAGGEVTGWRCWLDPGRGRGGVTGLGYNVSADMVLHILSSPDSLCSNNIKETKPKDNYLK